LISLLDADDFFAPSKLARVVSRFHENQTGSVLHPLKVVDGEGRVTGQIPVLGRVEQGWIAERVVRRGGRWRFLPTSAIAFRREVAHAIFPIPDSFRAYADAFAFTLLPLLTTIDYIEAPLAVYRQHGGNVTLSENDGPEKVRRNAEMWLRILELANQRMESLGFDRRMWLDADRNLEYRQRKYVVDLLAGELSRPELMKHYLGLSKLIAHDDLYPMSHRVALLLLFATAVIPPQQRRGAWLEKGWSLAPTIKRRLSRMRHQRP
jgi:hypothetical protein